MKTSYQSSHLLNELNTYLTALFMYAYFNHDQNNYFTLKKEIHIHYTRLASNIHTDLLNDLKKIKSYNSF